MIDLDTAVNYQDDRAAVRASDQTRTHQGNVERLARARRGDLLYAQGLNWLVWDGTRYNRAEMGEVTQAVIDVAKSIYSESARAFSLLGNPEVEKGSDEAKAVSGEAGRIRAWARESEQIKNVRGTIALAQEDKAFRARPEAFDAQTALLNTANGTLDLVTFELRPHCRDDRITRSTLIPYDPEATCPLFEANVEHFQPDPEKRSFLQRYAGHALLGERNEHVVYNHGPGANFKSTFEEAITAAAGEYGWVTQPDILIAHRGRMSVSDRSQLASLRGRRLVTTSEPEKDQALAGGMLKILTNTTINAEVKFGLDFRFMNQMSFMFSSNHKLHVSDHTDGLWRKIWLVEWTVKLPDEERIDDYFKTYIEPELPGVLRWMVDGLRDYRARGNRLDPPAQVLASTQRYRHQQDLVARWLEDECTLAPGDDTVEESTEQLWSSFDALVKSEKGDRVSRSEWKQRLAEMGLEDYRKRTDDGPRERYYRHVKLQVRPV